MKISILIIAALVITACSSPAQPTPTNVPPPAVQFAWTASPTVGVTGYNLYWGTSSSNYFTNVYVGSNLTFTVTNFNWNTTYFVNVTASSLNLTSAYAGEISYSIPSPPAPPGPANVITH